MRERPPPCPGCGESTRVTRGGPHTTRPRQWYCTRCTGWCSALTPRPGRYAPDFDVPLRRGRRKKRPRRLKARYAPHTMEAE